MENSDNTMEHPEILEETPKSKKRQKGQALLEFTLTIPILLLIMLGIIDFGRIFFTFAQASSAIRDGARFAAVLGYGTTKPYLDCDGIKAAVGDFWFADSTTITINYEFAAGGSKNCNNTGDVLDSDLVNGDMLQIQLDAQITLIAYSNLTLDLDFFAQRTIVKTLDIGADFDDAEYDGLADTWEVSYFGSAATYVATDDPDGDGCNNGCEENRGSDPTVDDTLADPSVYTDGYFPAPDPAFNFTATAVCSGPTMTSVTVDWDNISPAPSYIEIRNASDDSLATPAITAPTSGTGNVSITPAGALVTYYAVVFQAHPTELGVPPFVYPHSIFSPQRTATCAPPEQPQNLIATPDCTLGEVDFSWDPFTVVPQGAEIRLSSDDSVVSTLSDLTLTSCTNCGGSIGPTQSITYYMVSITSGVESAHSAPAIASCTGFPSGTGSITGKVWYDRNPNGNQSGAQEIDVENALVTLTYNGGSNPQASQLTNVAGIFSFTGLGAGSYTVTIDVVGSTIYDLVVYTATPNPYTLTAGEAYNPGLFFGLDDAP